MKRIFIVTALLCSIAHADQQKNVAQLKSYISNADVIPFKAAYAVESAQENKTQLLELAQSTQQKLTDELESWGNGTINKKKLALGALQALATVYCLAQVGYVAYGAIMPLKLYLPASSIYAPDTPAHINQKSVTMFLKCPALFIYAVLHVISTIHCGNGKYATATVAPTLCALSAYGAYKACKASAKNFKQGWNYKAHLEQQIKNIDEIITHIQNPTIAPAIKEQV